MEWDELSAPFPPKTFHNSLIPNPPGRTPGSSGVEQTKENHWKTPSLPARLGTGGFEQLPIRHSRSQLLIEIPPSSACLSSRDFYGHRNEAGVQTAHGEIKKFPELECSARLFLHYSGLYGELLQGVYFRIQRRQPCGGKRFQISTAGWICLKGFMDGVLAFSKRDNWM